MINLEQIGGLFKNPKSIKESELADISALVIKYPYCSSLYTLELIGLAKFKSVNFENRLKITASHVSDRAHLHRLIQLEEDEIATEKEEAILDLIQEKTEEVVVEEEIINANIETPEETFESKEALEEIDDKEAEILSQVVESTFNIEIDGKPSVVKETEKKEVKKISTEKKEKNKTVSIDRTEKKVPKRLARPANMSFIEWLKYKQDSIQDRSVKQVQSIEESSSNKSLSKKEINALLDKFIEEEPSISSFKKDQSQNASEARKSVEESLDIVSETLAKIHELQGNYIKAIAAYRQLSLLYPEKKVFFASQIEKIKEKLS